MTGPVALAAALAVSPTGVVANAQRIAVSYWHTNPCRVTVRYRAMPMAYNAVSTWATGPTDCTITFNTRPVWGTEPWQKFCTVMVHEYGHLTGHHHSTDPVSVMYPVYEQPVGVCA